MGPEILSSARAGVWRKVPKAFPDSSSVLDNFNLRSNADQRKLTGGPRHKVGEKTFHHLTTNMTFMYGPYAQYSWDFPEEIPERLRKDPGDALWNSPREYDWDPSCPIIQGI